MDEKYRKRRNQKTEERFRRALLMFGISILLLIFTVRTMIESSQTIEDRIDRHTLVGAMRRRRVEKESFEKNSNTADWKNSGSGFFHGLFQDDRIASLDVELGALDQAILENKNSGFRWVRTDLLPPLKRGVQRPLLQIGRNDLLKWGKSPDRFFKVKRIASKVAMAWESEKTGFQSGPTIDFTKHDFVYPEKKYELPTLGEYPKLIPTSSLMAAWPQDDIDHPPTPFHETLIHFDFNDPRDLDAARIFREAKLPFKFVNVPELLAANKKWTDQYLADNFDSRPGRSIPRAQGTCQESKDNFFAFYAFGAWPAAQMGLPPTRNSDWTFEKWAEHARFADATGLHAHKPHFYFQAGVEKEERYLRKDQWTFISRDLPSFSSPSETTLLFEAESQKGIQCRFSERSVTAATHFDSGRNMIGMISGAKRYVLHPPSQCSKLGIVTERSNPIFRHSMLNFGHMGAINNPDMPEEERNWLGRAGTALGLETILKAGEVLYIPSHWFHYIISLQKSAQCNVRSGIDTEGDAFFGGKRDVVNECNPVELAS